MINWDEWGGFNVTQEEWDKLEGPVRKLLLNHTKEELLTESFRRRCPVCPVSSPSEVVNSTQLRARQFWIEVEHPELNATIKYPGFCLRFSETPCQVWRRAPLIGEHNLEIYRDELGLSIDEITLLKQAGVI